MKRNFLLTLLLTLLPFVGWAQDPVAKIGDSGYETLQDAIDHVTTGGIIVLQKDITANGTAVFALGKEGLSYTIDMNGHDIEAQFGWNDDATKRHLFNLTTSNTKVKIINSQEETTSTITGSVANATVDYDISMIRVGIKDETNCPSGSSLTIGSGVSVVSTNTMCAIDVLTNKNDLNNKNTVNIEGSVSTTGTSTAGDYYTVGTHGHPSVRGGIINVYEGATITGTDAAIYLPGGECNIYAGTITGAKAGVIAKAGQLFIGGGIITCTATTVSGGWAWSGDGATGKGHALQVENGQGSEISYPEAPVSVKVKGGKFVSANDEVVNVYTYEIVGANEKFLKGGNYSNSVERYVADGFVESKADDETYNVKPDGSSLVEVQVSPTNTQSLVYGTPVEDLKVTSPFFSITESAFLTDEGRQQIANVLIFKNAEELSRADVGTAYYTLNLNKESDLYDATTGKLIIEKDDKYYNIVPLGMKGEVEITKGQNELILDNDLPLITVKKDLKYTAAAQVLVNVPTGTKVATLGGVEYFSISKADYKKAFEDAAVTEAQAASAEPLTEAQIAAIKAAVVPPAADSYDVTAENAKVKATWNSELPTGTEIDDYYVWVRAAGGGSNYDASAPKYIGFAVIGVGTPVIAGEITGVDDKYYLKTRGNNWKHLYSTNGNGSGAAIVPGGVFTATIGGVTKDVPASSVTFQVQKATYNTDGSVKKDEQGNIIWETENGRDKTYNVWGQSNFGDFAVGFYRVRVAIDGITDFSERVGGGQSEPYKVFEVVKPTYTVKVTASSTVVPYDNQASVTFSYTVDHTGYAPEFRPAAPDAEDQSIYTWYTSNGFEAQKTDDKYAAGEYKVAIVPNLFNARGNDFVAQETEAAQVSIVAGEILAKIEDQELVYGQTLPLYLTFDSGSGIAPTDTRAINEFNSTPRGTGFTATLIEDAEGNAPEATVEMPLTGTVTTNNNLRNTTLLPVGTWKVSGNFGGDATNRILASSATWKVTPKDIANEDFNNPGVEGMRNRELNLLRTYTSNPIELTAEDLNGKFTYRNKNLVLGEDFEITDYANNVNAGTATFTITGKGNFTGTRENRRFTIDKAKIYVRPAADQEWSIGTPVVDENGKSKFTVDWDSPEVVEGEGNDAVVTDRGGIYAQLEYFQQDRKKKKDMAVENGFKALAARIAVPSNVDFYPNGLVAYAENDEEADNYQFVFQNGPLTIKPGLIQIQLADQETDYAFVEPTITTKKFELVNGDDLNPILAENLKANLNSVIVFNLDKVKIVKDWNTKKQEVTIEGDETKYYRYPVGNYPFTAEVSEGAFTATNYKIVVVPRTANLTVNPVEITVKAENQTVDYADFLDEDGAFDADAKEEFIEGITEVKPANVAVNPALKGQDQLTDVIASLSVNTDNEIVVALVNPENPNYTVTNIDDMNGTLTVNALPGIALLSEAATYDVDQYGDPNYDADGNLILTGGDLKKINDYNNMPVEYVTLKLKAASVDPANEAFTQWKAGEWHAMVLPFDVTVGDIASQFRYAILNVVDKQTTEASSKPNDVHFMLPEITDVIKANTPFCIKSQFDFNYEETTLNFGHTEGAFGETYPIVIKYNEKPSVIADEVRGYTFEGTYDVMVLDNTTPQYRFLGPNSQWKFFGPSSTSKYTMQPYTGYVNVGTANATREVNFFFEEEDGSTTAINAADFVNGNKANAEGLYRIDGVKVQGATTQKGVYIQDGKKFVK